MPKQVFQSLFVFFLLFNLGTLLYSAWNEGYVHDEPMYVEIGKMILDGQRPEAGWGHPPLSIWTGTWLPWKLGFRNDFDPMTLFLARLSHIFVNLLGGGFIAYCIFRKRGEFPSLFFLLLYSTLSLLKFSTSHHLTDSDSTVLAASALTCLWAFPQASGPLLLFLLATMSKISMVLTAPFIGLPILKNRRAVNLLLPFLFVSLCLTYRFQFSDFSQYFEIIKLQLGRAVGGAPNSLLGNRIDGGAWYYYFVVGFYKSPLLWIGLLFFALSRKPKREDLWYFLLPASLIFLVFTRSTLQLGFRYINLSVLLLSIYISISITMRKEWQTGFLVALSVFFLGLDLHTLLKGSYQTYFNFLATRPAVNFTDSNIDWHQKIPRHLEPLAPVSQPVKNHLDFLIDPNRKNEIFKTTSMELNGIWHHPAGVLFRGLKPSMTIAGHEFHLVSKQELYRLFEERPPFYFEKTKSFATWDAPLAHMPYCRAGQTFSVHSAPLFDLEAVLRKIPDDSPSVTEKVSVKFAHLGKSLVIVESTGPVDIRIGDVEGKSPRGSIEEYRHFSYWFPFDATAAEITAILTIEKRNKFLNRDIKAKALQVWYECK